MDIDTRVFWVVVLGDFGRSPRMQYHVRSLASKPGAKVHIVSYGGSSPLSGLTEADNVSWHKISEPPPFLLRFPRFISLILKAVHQLLVLLQLLLFALPKPNVVLLQNPPAVPTMAVCWIACRKHHATFVIDWHNYGYTILSYKTGSKHLLVKGYRMFERTFGQAANKHFCVTRAMKQDLRMNWDIDAVVLFDRPPARFQRSTLEQTHDLFLRLRDAFSQDTFPDWLSKALRTLPTEQTVVTRSSNSVVNWSEDRPVVVVSSTSWTPDEDFSLLLEGAVAYDALAAQNPKLPRMLILVTGKGPQKAFYLSKIATLDLNKVAIRTLWLEPEDYPVLLGSADLGVCLHASSSGLDLPMKVVDMFGCGLPVCALSYHCICELVQDQVNGLLFTTAGELAQQFSELLLDFPKTKTLLLEKLQKGAAKEQQLRWDGNWDRIAWPVLQG